MKSISKILFVCAVAVSAIAMSGASAEAAKKKGKACTAGTLCSTACVGVQCRVNVCGGDGKWYQAMFTPVCWTPGCPAKC